MSAVIVPFPKDRIHRTKVRQRRIAHFLPHVIVAAPTYDRRRQLRIADDAARYESYGQSEVEALASAHDSDRAFQLMLERMRQQKDTERP